MVRAKELCSRLSFMHKPHTQPLNLHFLSHPLGVITPFDFSSLERNAPKIEYTRRIAHPVTE